MGVKLELAIEKEEDQSQCRASDVRQQTRKQWCVYFQGLAVRMHRDVALARGKSFSQWLLPRKIHPSSPEQVKGNAS